jgi:hypothetical protein
MKIDYSDVDENQRVRCEACLPDNTNKEDLWKHYTQKSKFSQGHFDHSSSFFYDHSNHEQCLAFADKFFADIEAVKEKFHRDYGGIFFRNLSPTFLGLPEHLEKFKAIHDRAVAKGTDSHFIKILSNEIEALEEILKIKY